jgi:hypothetical protein
MGSSRKSHHLSKPRQGDAQDRLRPPAMIFNGLTTESVNGYQWVLRELWPLRISLFAEALIVRAFSDVERPSQSFIQNSLPATTEMY